MYTDIELKTLSKHAYENACELLDDAIILFEVNRYPRAFVLAHLASEELAKLPIIYGFRVRLFGKETIDWGSFKKRLQNHQPKLRSIALFDYMNDDVDLIRNTDLDLYNKQIELTKEFDNLKNMGLYSGNRNAYFYKPSMLVSESMASNMIKTTKGRIRCLLNRWAGMIDGEITEQGYAMHLKIQEVTKSMSSANK